MHTESTGVHVGMEHFALKCNEINSACLYTYARILHYILCYVQMNKTSICIMTVLMYVLCVFVYMMTTNTCVLSLKSCCMLRSGTTYVYMHVYIHTSKQVMVLI